MNLTFVDGNCVEAEYSRPTILVHCTNTEARMGAGIAKAIAKKWPDVNDKYEEFCKKGVQQGQIQVVQAEKNLYICNLFGQSGIGDFEGLPAVRYGALEEGFLRLRKRLIAHHSKFKSLDYEFDIVMPRIGCSLAGASWVKVEEIVSRVFSPLDINVTVYTFGPYNP